MPNHVREALAGVAAADRASTEYERRQERKAEQQRERERRERRAALPAAERVVAWARELEALVAGADVPAAFEIYREPWMSVSVTREGALRVRHWSKFGHGVVRPDTTSPAMLVKHAHAPTLVRIARRIDSGAIWDDIAEHAVRRKRELDDLQALRRPFARR